LKRGYVVLITADHGMDGEKSHGGTAPGSRGVPLYMILPGQPGLGNMGETVSQLRIAPTVLMLMGLPIPETMTEPPIVTLP
jgi:bisphosphoglycerate-independent phosphoglycerate mutase (AlkP superfamily)